MIDAKDFDTASVYDFLSEKHQNRKAAALERLAPLLGTDPIQDAMVLFDAAYFILAQVFPGDPDLMKKNGCSGLASEYSDEHRKDRAMTERGVIHLTYLLNALGAIGSDFCETGDPMIQDLLQYEKVHEKHTKSLLHSLLQTFVAASKAGISPALIADFGVRHSIAFAERHNVALPKIIELINRTMDYALGHNAVAFNDEEYEAISTLQRKSAMTRKQALRTLGMGGLHKTPGVR
ncbi:hypothetical protein [Noviherbaspirillum malthae]|uniref:hypothetical protein n=1 Tax=Noviherbaspirillum malthae TaxID=1260987 RepID=UPI00188E8A37|nr:hypothetical protein [Noviherbaspirillum malthae]